MTSIRRLPLPLRLALMAVGLVAVGVVVLQPLGNPGPDLRGAGGERSAGFVPVGDTEDGGLPVAASAPELVGGGDPPLTDLSGRPVELADFAGRPIWIVFWATWCPPCRDEMPALSAAAQAYEDEGLVMLAVSVEEPIGDVQAFVDELDLGMRVLTDPRGRSSRRYAIFGLPTHYLIGRDGTIAWRQFGPLSAEEIDRRARDAVAPGGD